MRADWQSNSYGATKTKAQSKYVSNKVLKKWKKGWHSRAGRKYYCVKKGKLAKGWKKIGKSKYYFDKKMGSCCDFVKRFAVKSTILTQRVQ